MEDDRLVLVETEGARCLGFEDERGFLLIPPNASTESNMTSSRINDDLRWRSESS